MINKQSSFTTYEEITKEPEKGICPFCKKEIYSKQILRFQDKDIRMTVENGERWFVAKDICNALAVKRIKTVLKFVPKHEKKIMTKIQVARLDRCDSNRYSNIKMIHEKGVLKLVSIADRGWANDFHEWVNSIRTRNGEF